MRLLASPHVEKAQLLAQIRQLLDLKLIYMPCIAKKIKIAPKNKPTSQPTSLPSPLPHLSSLPHTLPRRKNLTTLNPNLLNRPIRPSSLDPPEPLNNIHAVNHSAKNRMRAIQMPRRRERDEKLTPVRIRARVRHAQHAGGGVRELRDDFVAEPAAAPVDAAAAAAGARRVAGLDHEVPDHAVDGRVVVVVRCREGGEVVACLFG